MVLEKIYFCDIIFIMDNFKKFGGPGGLRGRKEFIGGRPKSDAQYGPKKRVDDKKISFGGGKPFFGGKGGGRDSGKSSFGGSRGGDRGGSRGFDRGGDRDRRPIEMHKATCSTCGNACEVPFRPDGSKPVLCRDCFNNKPQDQAQGMGRDRAFSGSKESPDFSVLTRQLSILESKLDEILAYVKVSNVRVEETVEAKKEVVTKPKKETTATVNKSSTPKKVAKKVVKKAAKK